jgi:hypothetical protein
MQTKTLEIRDRATFIPCLAIKMMPENDSERFLLRRDGYGTEFPLVLFGRLSGGPFIYECHDWKDRTMFTAHRHVEQYFDTLKDGDVIDVEFILGETTAPKISERFDHGF